MFEHLRDLFAIGAVIGLGQLLANPGPVTVRVAVGRALCAGGLGGSAASALILWPDMPPAALLGLACALTSLGTSALEAFINRAIGR